MQHKSSRIYLIGFMGSGKSSIGKLLSKQLSYEHIDTDLLIESKLDTNISSIFDKYGEEEFREIEKAILNSILGKERVVISCGGGLPCFKNNIELLNKTGLTVYLKALPMELYSRLKKDLGSRPLLGSGNDKNLMSRISELLNDRKACYEKAKLIIMNSNNLDSCIEQVLAHISTQPNK